MLEIDGTPYAGHNTDRPKPEQLDNTDRCQGCHGTYREVEEDELRVAGLNKRYKDNRWNKEIQ